MNGIPKLADVGLVTEAAAADSFVGTVGYIPPEGPNTPRADVYGLGKVLYEASMGKDRHAFPEPLTSIEATPEADALMELNAVVLKACALDPKAGYQSAEEMHVDLALLQSGRSVKRKRTLEKRILFVTRIGIGTGMIATLLATAYVYHGWRHFAPLRPGEFRTGGTPSVRIASTPGDVCAGWPASPDVRFV